MKMDCLIEEMKEYGWKLTENNNDTEYCFKSLNNKPENNIYSYIIISRKDDTTIGVSIPLKYSNDYNYKTYFTDFTKAYNYILNKVDYLKW